MKWIISFADGTQCGDGTIYRASGFVLTGIKVNNQIWEAPSGKVYQANSARGVSNCNMVHAAALREVDEYHKAQVFSRTSLTDGRSKQKQAKNVLNRTTTKARHILETGASSMKIFKNAGWKPKEGFQLRYIYFLDPTAKDRLTVPILPFSEIEKRGAGMYKGIKRPKQAMASDQEEQRQGSTDPDAPIMVK